MRKSRSIEVRPEVDLLRCVAQQAFCVIFTRLEAFRLSDEGHASASINREKPRLVCLLRDPAAPLAPIPVTRLWTGCTWLKIRELQMQSFH